MPRSLTDQVQYLVARYDQDRKISYEPGSREFIEVSDSLFLLTDSADGRPDR